MQYWSPTSTMDGLFFQVWHVSVWLDMARQVITRNDSTGAFWKCFTYHEDFNHEQRYLLWVQTYFHLVHKCEQISFRIFSFILW